MIRACEIQSSGNLETGGIRMLRQDCPPLQTTSLFPVPGLFTLRIACQSPPRRLSHPSHVCPGLPSTFDCHVLSTCCSSYATWSMSTATALHLYAILAKACPATNTHVIDEGSYTRPLSAKLLWPHPVYHLDPRSSVVRMGRACGARISSTSHPTCTSTLLLPNLNQCHDDLHSFP